MVGVAYSPKVEEDYYPVPTDDSLYAFNGNISPFMVGSSTTPIAAEAADTVKNLRRTSLAKSSDVNQITRRLSMATPSATEGNATGRRVSLALQPEAAPSPAKRLSMGSPRPTDFSQITRRISLAINKMPTTIPSTPGGQSETSGSKNKWPIATLRSYQKFMQLSKHRRIRTLGNVR